LWRDRHKCDIITAWVESRQTACTKFCMDMIGYFQ
jgi:hypothetical protein